MIEVCEHINIATYTLSDPTRTTTLRNAFVRDSNRRFNELTAVIRKAVHVEDVFGLKEEGDLPLLRTFQMGTPGVRAFAFPRSSDKVEAFMKWFNSQVDAGILQVSTLPQVGTGIETAWTNKYIHDSYKRGVIRARYELQKAGFDVPGIDQTGGIAISMSTPFHIDRLGLLYSRTFSELKGITTAMDQQISRVLAQGMADGDGPALLARKLVATINGTGVGQLGITDSLGRFIPAKRRAQIMARTEMIRAHHQATIQEYRNWAVEGVRVKAEWVTAGDNRVCDRCNALEREIFTLDTINGMIPVHPNCRCIALPWKDPAGVSQVSAGEPTPLQLNKKLIDDLYKVEQVPGSVGDDFMAQLNKVRGVDKIPKHVGGAEMDRLIAQGYKQMYRGVANETYVTQFAEGELFAGKGVFGNGTYVVYGDGANAYKVAKHFASGAGDSGVMRMTMPRNMKVIKYDDLIVNFSNNKYRTLAREMDAYANDLILQKHAPGQAKNLISPIRGIDTYEDAKKAAQVLGEISKNPGRVALAEGYDAIIPSINQPLMYAGTEAPEMVILNRSKIILQWP